MIKIYESSRNIFKFFKQMNLQKSHIISVVATLIVILSLLSFTTGYFEKAPLEKIYTQTDRSFYFPEETIWFKSYIVTSANTISTVSDFVNAELISPKGVVAKKIKLSIVNGYAYGDFYIEKDWVGGIYTLKVYTNWMRNFGDEALFTKKITVQKIVKPNLLLNLKFEKEGYGPSSIVTANFEAKDLKNNPLKRKSITVEVSAKGRKIITKSIVTNTEGKAKPTFTLPENLKTTDVVLNVLVPYQGTTESISRSVPVVLDTIDLQFFPESGKLIAGTTNTIAFKALNEFGKPVDVKGDIVDENNNVITSFNSFHDGMGAFELSTKKRKSYYAKIKSPFISKQHIGLPKCHEKGVKFSVSKDSLSTKLSFFSTEKKTYHLEVSNATAVLLNKTVMGKKDDIDINTKDFPMGITKFSILDAGRNIVAERLVFINDNKQLHIDLELDKDVYETREKTKVTITTTNANNKPIPSNISVAVADNKLVSFADDKQDHILSYLLVSSELKGNIHKPSFYFNPKEPKSNKALDYVMLTHGWRDYINAPIPLENTRFKPEQKGIQSGKVVNKKGKPIEANLMLFDNRGDKVLTFKSNAEGKFQFKSNSQTEYTLLAYNETGEKLNVIKNTFQAGYKTETDAAIQKKNREKTKVFPRNKKPIQETIKEDAVANIALAEDSAQLDEVVVVGYGTTNKKEVTGSVARVVTEELSASGVSIAAAVQGRVAGVNVITANGSPGNASKIMIRGVSSISGNNAPLYVVDGVPTDEISHLDPSQINSVDILRDASATAIYGSRGANGVILIATKSGNFYNNWNKKRLNNTKFKNYAVTTFYNYSDNAYTDRPRTFYVPKYNSKIIPDERTDFRQTIYWNPVVQTDENGKAEFEFYNSDAITSFKITAEGIGYNGLVGRQNKAYATKKSLSVDFKTPNYMALNDAIVLPITITNETKNSITAHLDLILTKHLEILEPFDNQVVIAADTSIIRHIKVVPIKKDKDVTIQVALKSSKYQDVMKKQTTILSPYFPTEVSISKSESNSFSFNINHAVTNSVEAEFNVYTDVIGDVMGGIEGLIRKPYGCFEQTSSATYPNIMILKYLKATGKSNPKIEHKAKAFIRQGYRKLVSFETKEGGFEWFGRTPPHETLTAYGILEFTEMKDVYKGVDQKMLDRTTAWLLDQRDGKGGFKKSKKGYWKQLKNVANAYIVYALTEAKVSSDLSLEYKTAYNEALNSNDTYRMSLLALASYNLNKLEHAEKLMSKIKLNIDKYGFKVLPVEHTITRSYWNAKQIETAAFTVLALIKQDENNDALIAQGIKYIVDARRGARFGSTQSTAMALKALIAYAKRQKRIKINPDDTVELVINGKAIQRKLTTQEDGKITITGLSKYLKKGNENVTVTFSNPEISFPYALDVTWDSRLPNTSTKCPLTLETVIPNTSYNVGDNVSMAVNIANTKTESLGMVTAIIGIPSGATPQPWQLKELLEQNKVAYYEVFDNYLVFYWREFNASETKSIRLDLKADIAGDYKAPASTAYLYYGDEYKTWISGNALKIDN